MTWSVLFRPAIALLRSFRRLTQPNFREDVHGPSTPFSIWLR